MARDDSTRPLKVVLRHLSDDAIRAMERKVEGPKQPGAEIAADPPTGTATSGETGAQVTEMGEGVVLQAAPERAIPAGRSEQSGEPTTSIDMMREAVRLREKKLRADRRNETDHAAPTEERVRGDSPKLDEAAASGSFKSPESEEARESDVGTEGPQ
ncbi:uncharacterized protein LOC143905737 isoform X2 [Temnothorax americanus]|uniref:uncharacterized protein LOC143905737 isoform X2 n=1 Tax=Temnothorax americanus TaxID=1964332 RepID=UPI0040694F39